MTNPKITDAAVEALAQQIFSAHRSDWRATELVSIPPWDKLTEGQRQHWCRVAAALPHMQQADRKAIRMLVAARLVTEAKANEALQIAHGFTRGELTPAQPEAAVVIQQLTSEQPEAGVPDGWRDAADDILHKLAEWSRAYPEDVFPEPSKEDREWLHATRRGLMDRISASMGRHMVRLIERDLASLKAALAAAGRGG